MDLRRLRYFLAIVEEGSFSRAATRLNVAQPALSMHVRKMEEALGAQLLLRGPHGVTPTEAGELLARRSRAMISDLHQTEEEIRCLGRKPSGTVRLGLPGTISDIISLPLIARCREHYPEIKIIVAEAMSGFVREWLLDGRVDLAVLYSNPREAGLHAEALLDEELVLLMPPNTAKTDTLAWEILAEMSLILPSQAHGLRIMLDSGMRAQGLAVEPDIEIDSFANIKRLVERGYGCSILPFHAVANEEREGRLSVCHFPKKSLSRRAFRAHLTMRPLTAAATVVDGLLRSVVNELIEDMAWVGASHADPKYDEQLHDRP